MDLKGVAACTKEKTWQPKTRISYFNSSEVIRNDCFLLLDIIIKKERDIKSYSEDEIVKYTDISDKLRTASPGIYLNLKRNRPTRIIYYKGPNFNKNRYAERYVYIVACGFTVHIRYSRWLLRLSSKSVSYLRYQHDNIEANSRCFCGWFHYFSTTVILTAFSVVINIIYFLYVIITSL